MKLQFAARLVPFLCAPALLAGQSNPRQVQPERPTVATHAGTVARGFLEIEAGVEEDNLDGSVHPISIPIVAKIGLGPTTQLSLMTTPNDPGGSSIGLGDVGAGVKWRMVDDAPLLGRFAIFPSVKLPTGASSTGRGTGTTDLSFLLISSHQSGPTSVDVNLGYTRRSGDGSVAPVNATVWTVSVGRQLSDRFGFVYELFGYPATNGPSGARSTTSLLFGPTFSDAPSRAIDVGGIITKVGTQLGYAVYAGGVFNLGRIFR